MLHRGVVKTVGLPRQVLHHGEDAPVALSALLDPELRVHVGGVPDHGLLREVEALGDRRVLRPSAIRARTSRWRPVSPARGSPGRGRSIIAATTTGSRTVPPSTTVHVADEGVEVGDALLEQVPDAPLAAFQELGRVPALHVLGEHGIGVYGGGMFEQGPGRGQLQYLGSLFHPDGPNDIAPPEYNLQVAPIDLPRAPLAPDHAPIGFRWGTYDRRRSVQEPTGPATG